MLVNTLVEVKHRTDSVFSLSYSDTSAQNSKTLCKPWTQSEHAHTRTHTKTLGDTWCSRSCKKSWQYKTLMTIFSLSCMHSAAQPWQETAKEKEFTSASACWPKQPTIWASKHRDSRQWKQHTCFPQAVDRQKKKIKMTPGGLKNVRTPWIHCFKHGVLITSVPASQNRHFWNS